jgi:uncharacterized repeat protein (TIGR03803 family)
MAIYQAVAFETNYPPVPYGIVQHIFTRPINGINPAGANPAAGLVFSGGVLCGTTLNGGLQGAGTTFSLNPDASGFTLIRAFTNQPDANYPEGELDFTGTRFFGGSFGGGVNGTGTIFAGQTNGSVSVLRSFAAASEDNATNSGGASPAAPLASSGSTLFGATTTGGGFANGTLFSIGTNGLGYSVLHDFTLLDSLTGTNADGAVPWAGLILSGNILYGTASGGGNSGDGVVFAMATNGANFTALHHFSAMDSITATNSEGAVPMSGLVLSGSTLFGTTSAGGQGGSGTVFSVETNGQSFAVLHHFSSADPVSRTNADGAAPSTSLALAGNLLFGVTPSGGRAGNGTVFTLRAHGTQFQTLHSFSSINPANGTNADGAVPLGALLPLGDSLYGTTFTGGPGSAGTVFRLPIPVLPAIITNITVTGNANVTLFFLGAANSTNVIQACSSLQPPVNWQNLSTNAADPAGQWQFTEVIATNGTRFYRSYAQ